MYSRLYEAIVQIGISRYVTEGQSNREVTIMMKHTLVSAIAVLVLVAGSAQAQTGAPRLLPGTKPNVLSSISGKAVNTTGSPVANSVVRLRDVRTGRVMETAITDKAGQFEFKPVDVGSYIVEMMSPSSDAVIASSSILHVGAGDVLTTLLKMPFSGPAYASLAANAAPSALQIVTTAAQAVVAAAPTGEPATSQNPTR
jgi:Carboxypeptidase regulatory-like domain